MLQHDVVQKNYYLSYLFSSLIALSLFVVGRFGFFDILGLKRVMEVLLFIPIGIFGLILSLIIPRYWNNPFLLMPLTYLFFQFLWHSDKLELGGMTFAVLIIVIIFSLGTSFSNLLLRQLIKIATLFAVLGLIQFVIFLFDPSLAKDTLLFYDNYSGSLTPVIENYLQLLGLTDGTSYHLWGLNITRLRSFASEPSLLVGYFLVPGALALTLGRRYRLCGLLCILFCLTSFAGSVFVALALSFFASSLLLIRWRYFSVMLPFVIFSIFVFLLYTHYNDLILISHTANGGFDFLDKTNSANMRFSYIHDFIPKVIFAPLGLEEEIYQPLGLIVRSMAQCGIIGFFLSLIVLFKLFLSIGDALLKKNLLFLQKMGLLIVYGSLMTGLIYLDNCFIQLYGFTLLLLTYNQIIELQPTCR